MRFPERGRIVGEAYLTGRPDGGSLAPPVVYEQFAWRAAAAGTQRRALAFAVDRAGRHTVRLSFEAPDGRRSRTIGLRYRVR